MKSGPLLHLFNSDNVHVPNDGNMKLVRAIKIHLNPKLGLPAYTMYKLLARHTRKYKLQSEAEAETLIKAG